MTGARTPVHNLGYAEVGEMKNAAIAGFPGHSSQHLRPSTACRIEKLRALVAELGERDMGSTAIATFLNCSSSSARNYVFELLDAGVVKPPIRQPAGCVDKTVYRLNRDPLLLSQFHATLAGTENCKNVLETHGGQKHEAGISARFFLNMRDAINPSPGVCSVPARRDPLVTALFGAPSLPK